MSKRYNWKEIRAKREAGHNIKDLALEYSGYNENDKKFAGVYAYFRKKLKDVKVDTSVTKRIQEKIKNEEVEGLAEKEIDLRIEYNKLNKYIRYEVAGELRKREGTSFERLKQLKISSEILENCRKMDWEIHEIQEVAKKIEQKIDTGETIDLSDLTTKEIKKFLKK